MFHEYPIRVPEANLVYVLPVSVKTNGKQNIMVKQYFAHYVDVQIDCRVSINILLSTEAAYQESANHHYMKHGLVSVILLHVILAFRKVRNRH